MKPVRHLSFMGHNAPARASTCSILYHTHWTCADKVPKEFISSILAAARHVHSYENTQPWQITVIQGEARDRLSNAMLEYFDAGRLTSRGCCTFARLWVYTREIAELAF
eukprot:4829189-Amphidinium_carterae.2